MIEPPPASPVSFKHFFTVPPTIGTELTINGLGLREGMPPCLIDRPTGKPDYLFMLFYDPVMLAATTSPHAAPVAMLWPPGAPQYYGHATAPFCHSWIHLVGPFVDRLILRDALPLATSWRVDAPAVAAFEQVIGALHRELTRPGPPDALIVTAWLTLWSRTLHRATQHAPEPEPPPALLAVRRHIDTHYAQPLRLADLARRAGFSVPHFCAEYRRWFGISALQYAMRLRLEEADYRLRDRNQRIGEIARQVGMSDLGQFAKLYRKYQGRSPSEARRAYLAGG